MKKRKLLEKIIAGSKNVQFSEMETVIKAFGFTLARVSGSHHIYNRADIPEIINIQNRKGQVPTYQVRQFLSLIEQYNLSLEEEE
ncbi:MAG TPA: type II toxin-antitoxin system HicA family toxin [Candidatus Sericytochromatia bacterium]